jgi:hypothetical protein
MKTTSFVILWLGLAVSVATASATAQAPSRDSVLLTGAPVQVSGFGSFELFALSATSGPSGEDPVGHINATAFGFLPLDGPVTCLAVRGNSATINWHTGAGTITARVLDGTVDTFNADQIGRLPSDCSPAPLSVLGGPLLNGDIVVVDAPALPSSKDQCKNGGWRDFGVFKNQGDCVSFVATGGKNPPAGH